MSSQTLYIMDIDGTLMDNSHREHLLPTGCGSTTEQWDAFNLACIDDKPIAHMWQLMGELMRHGHHILFLTGRSEICQRETRVSLNRASREIFSRKHPCDKVLCAQLLMREQSDHRSAADYKADMIGRIAALEGRRLVLVDDDERIIEACKDLVDEVIHVQPFDGCAGIKKTK